MKRVLVFTGWYPSPDNPTQFVFVQQQVHILNKILPTLTGEKWEFIVWNELMPTDLFNHCFRKNAINTIWDDEGITVLKRQSILISYRIPFNQDRLTLKSMGNTYQNVIQYFGGEPDLIWCVTLSSAVLWNRFQVQNKLRFPFILQEHSNPLSMHLKYPWNRVHSQEMLKNVLKVIIVAERQFKEFKDLDETCEPELLWNSVSEYFLKERVALISNSPFVFLFVGRISAEKGLIRLVKAARKLDQKGARFIFKIIGAGPEEKMLKFLIETYKISNRFEWLGSKSPEEISYLMDSCHVFVLPSFYENCPVALLEAQVKGLPCVCTVNGASEKVLLSGNGIAVEDNGDGDELVGALLKMIETYPYYDQNGIRSRSLSKFAPEVFAKRMLKIFALS